MVPTPRRNFLVVEDKPFVREFIRGLLVQLKAGEIWQAANGEEALTNIISNPRNEVDCIIADMVMSPINGLQLLQQIRTEKTRLRSDIPFVMVSSQKDAVLVKLAIVLDVSAYMVKPVSKGGLEAAINKAFQRKWTPQSPRSYAAIDVPTALVAADE